MKSQKLIVVDVDGTLVNDQKKITPRTLQALHRAQAEGHIVAIASGRPVEGIEEYADQLLLKQFHGCVATQNGTCNLDYATKELLSDHTIPLEEAKSILQYVESIPSGYFIYENGRLYTNVPEGRVRKRTADINRLAIEYHPSFTEILSFSPRNITIVDRDDRIPEVSRKILNIVEDRYTYSYSAPIFFEIMPKNASKGTAILEIADARRIAHENIIAFGDEGNDLEMISMAGTGVAMGNAIPKIKEAAKAVTLTNNEDGIAVYLEEHVLSDRAGSVSI
ncbi:MAG: Cof-type HAD-IIB family hydrolase [Peptoniphilaceae bacterium]|nr:Cof-type HAD-IIB family hydrolase [Peptoniphilaceae bacterium]MDY4196179.1 Cof-type HAD-IIB family hydrolase [Peptoniphilaceae bacterium]MDY6147367.1 Cof-type HAD-IIB family hydrolase [Peptoniphilaceae bacterium]